MRSRKRQTNWRPRLFLAIFFLALLLLGGGRQLWHIWHQGWDGQPVAVFILDREQGLLLLVRPEEKEVWGWVWPRDWPLTTVGDYGRLPLVGVGRLAREEKAPRLLAGSLMANLKVPIQLVLFQDQKTCLSKSDWQHCATSWLWYQGILRHANVAVGRRIDFVKLFLFLHRHRLNWQVKPVAGNNGGVRNFDWQLGQWREENWHLFLLPVVRQEAMSLAVYNAGGRAGIAQDVAPVFKAAGARVARVGDKEKQTGCSWLVSRAVRKTETFRYFYRLFPCPVTLSQKNFFDDTSQLQLWLGKFWFRFSKNIPHS